MFVGLMRLSLRIPGSGSLKERRQVLTSIKGRLRSRFNVSVAQIDDAGHWNGAKLGMVVVGDSRDYLNGQLETILRFIEENYPVEVFGLEKEII